MEHQRVWLLEKEGRQNSSSRSSQVSRTWVRENWRGKEGMKFGNEIQNLKVFFFLVFLSGSIMVLKNILLHPILY